MKAKQSKMTLRKQLFILNALALMSLSLGCLWLNLELSERAMFFGADSKDYLSVANWMFYGDETVFTSTRPLLYPLLMGIPYSIFGVTGIWILHFGCWLITVNLTFLTVRKWTNHQVVAWIAAGIIVLNLSLISLIFQGLTELVTTALLSILCYHVVSSRDAFGQARFGQKLLFILVLLTLVKPSFYYPTLLCMAVTLFVYRKQYRLTIKKLIYPLLIVVPILLQMTLVHVRHGSFTVSKIGGLTFTNYYFSQCVQKIEELADNQASIAFSETMNSDQKMDYLLTHKGVFVVQFVENIVLNIKADPSFLEIETKKQPQSTYAFMRFYNLLSLFVHILGSAMLVLLFFIAFFKQEKQIWIQLFIIGGISSYYIFITGLSFWQGDRLVLPAIALWVPLYAALFYGFGSKLMMRLKSR